jgi:hypothetical protein
MNMPPSLLKCNYIGRHMPLGTLQKWCGATSSLQIAFCLSSLSVFCLSSHFKYHKIMDIQKAAKSWAPCQALESEPPSCSLIFGIHVNEAITHKDVRLTNHSARSVHEQVCPHQELRHWHIAFKSSTKMKIGFGTFLPICICWINPDPLCLCPHSHIPEPWQCDRPQLQFAHLVEHFVLSVSHALEHTSMY